MLPVVWVEGHGERERIVTPNYLHLVDNLQLESSFLTRSEVAQLQSQGLFFLLIGAFGQDGCIASRHCILVHLLGLILLHDRSLNNVTIDRGLEL